MTSKFEPIHKSIGGRVASLYLKDKDGKTFLANIFYHKGEARGNKYYSIGIAPVNITWENGEVSGGTIVPTDGVRMVLETAGKFSKRTLERLAKTHLTVESVLIRRLYKRCKKWGEKNVQKNNSGPDS